jgi:hypothetical protein
MSTTRRRRSATTDGDAVRPVAAGRGRSWRRAARGVLIAVAGTAALSLAGPFALRPFADAAHAAGTAGEVSVAFVLDFGGSTGDQVTGCVTVPSSDTRYDALAAFVQAKGLAQPSYAPSGLLCSINGVPSSGCGQVVDGRYVYWAYFTGGAHSWIYASTGASGTVGTDDVEGWRFENPGSGNPGDPGPRTAPRYNSLCSPSTPSPPPTGRTGGGGGSGRGGGGTGGGGGGGRTPSTAHSHAPHGSPAAAGGPAGAVSSTTTSTTGVPASTSTQPSDASTSLPGASDTTRPTAGLTTTRHASPGGSGPGPDPMIVGGLLIAALAVAGYARWRKRPRTP